MTFARMLLAGLALATMLAASAWARTVRIETAVALADHSPESVELALKRALEATMQRAAAMGFTWIRLDGARVLGDSVVVRIVAGDAESQDGAGGELLDVSAQGEGGADGF